MSRYKAPMPLLSGEENRKRMNEYFRKVAKKRGMTLEQFHEKVMNDMYADIETCVNGIKAAYPIILAKEVVNSTPLYTFDATQPITFDYHYDG